MTTKIPGFPPLTEEQQAILATCPPPRHTGPPSRGQLTRITAAAGAGKTTTLLALAVRAAEQGHTHLSYVTFTRAAASDGRGRLRTALRHQPKNPTIDARTMHSFARQLLQQELPDGTTTNNPWSDKQIKTWISRTCRTEIERFLRPCITVIERTSKNETSRQGRVSKCREQVEFFIYKTLVNFCRSEWTLEVFKGKPFFGRDYYPAKLYHKAGGRGEDAGFSSYIYDRSDDRGYGFYASQAARLWEVALTEDIPSFDFSMKLAQLKKLRVPGSILLVDESQDMDACQVDWISKQQVEFGTHVYVVGDAAQAIYGFRGAKPQFLMGLRSNHDLMLTECWRFGPAVSKIANLVLYAKHHSEQTCFSYDGSPKNWKPYRTKPGIPDKEGLITTEKVSAQWATAKVTVIARTNATLLIEALEVLGFAFGCDDSDAGIMDDEGERVASDLHSPQNHEVTPSDDEQEGDSDDSLLPIPKIHINGSGEHSGINLWKRTFKLVESLFDLYMLSRKDGHNKMQLDEQLFPDFAKSETDWDSFCQECADKELTRYSNVSKVVSLCKERTLEAVDVFNKNVVERHVSAQEADIILTTCHAAKGMEWDCVQVCNDFVSCCTFQPKAAQRANVSPSKKKARIMEPWQFGFGSWGDDVNLLYVACTRAKHTLSVPPCLYEVLDAMDSVHAWYLKRDSGVDNLGIGIKGCKKVLSCEQAESFYESLVLPLRLECELTEDQSLLKCELIDS